VKRADTAAVAGQAPSAARERILETAYELFSRHGVRAVGIDRVIAEAGVAKMTLYRHFESKSELALGFLDLREQRWTHGWLMAESARRAADPRGRVCAIFDVLDDWFQSPEYEGWAFIRTVLELQDPDDPVRRGAVIRLDRIRELIRAELESAGVASPGDAAGQVQILMMGAIVSASRGDLAAARRAGHLATLLLDAPA
jgi:AcrR family transcriptional regulator